MPAKHPCKMYVYSNPNSIIIIRKVLEPIQKITASSSNKKMSCYRKNKFMTQQIQKTTG
jgi:hypothetical protein